jgi:hypothetical protein
MFRIDRPDEGGSSNNSLIDRCHAPAIRQPVDAGEGERIDDEAQARLWRELERDAGATCRRG